MFGSAAAASSRAIEEVDALLHSIMAASFRFVVAKLEAVGYHWRVRVLNYAKLAGRCAAEAAGVHRGIALPYRTAAFQVADDGAQGARIRARAGAASSPAPRRAHSLFLNPEEKDAYMLSRVPSDGGLAKSARRKIHSMRPPSSTTAACTLSRVRARGCVPIITPPTSSDLFLSERNELRRLSGIETFKLFTVGKSGVR